MREGFERGHLYPSTEQQSFPAGIWLLHQARYHLLSCLNRQIWQKNSWGWEGQPCPSWTGQTPPPSERDMVDLASSWDIRPTAVRQGPAGDGRGAAVSLGTSRVINCEWFICGSQQRTGVETFLKRAEVVCVCLCVCECVGVIYTIMQSVPNHKCTITAH